MKRFFVFFSLLILTTLLSAQDVTLMKGKVYSGKSLTPVTAKVTVTDHRSKEVVATFESNSETGKYLVTLPAGKKYAIIFSAPNFADYKEKVDCSKQKGYREINQDVELLESPDAAVDKIKKTDLKKINF